MGSIRSPWFAIAIVIAIVATAPSASAADWPRFRGPNGSGVAADQAPTPTSWSPTTNITWSTALPGPGISSPIVVGSRVFVTCYSGYGLSRDEPGSQDDLQRHLVCLDRNSGAILWDRPVKAALPEDEYAGLGVPEHGYATHTPASDGERIYVFFGKSGALAFDVDGRELWRNQRLGAQSDPNKWGSSSSPMLAGDVLVVSAGPESRVVYGLNKLTGEVIWTVTADDDQNRLSNMWDTPILSEVEGGRTDLVFGVTGEIWGLDPHTGARRWTCKNLAGWCFNTSVVAGPDLLVSVEGRGGFTLGLRPGGSGDVTATHVAWTGPATNRYATPVIVDDRVYYVATQVVHCLDAATGREIYKERLPEGAARANRKSGDEGDDFSSPVVADGKLYFAMRTGETHVLDATSRTFQSLAVNRVTADNEDFSATPAISDGQIFLRSNKRLYCIGRSSGQESSQ